MKRTIAPGVSFLLALSCLAGRADSLVTDNSFALSLYGDRKACKIGDILHIIVVEEATATHQASQKLQRQCSTEAGPGSGWLDFLKSMGYRGKHDSQDQASSVRTGTLQARVTVEVRQVLPNGNLVVEGRHYVKVNKDLQVITVRGVVRPRDVNADNTVYSYNVANLEIEYSGSDPARPGKRTGIISRILNILF
ncbi:MAG: flagellar basal body L-ring protein FlgH [Armatimonadetes bacterium]|nr:flagellar basal body L-ring protein FlgH [Armatimonadota bacterium]